MAVLPAASYVNGLEVQLHGESSRIRGRIEHPPGRISLLNLETGYRWAARAGDLPNPLQEHRAPCPSQHHNSAPVHGPSPPAMNAYGAVPLHVHAEWQNQRIEEL